MITINLLPKELQPRSASKKDALALVKDCLPQITLAIFAILIFLHIILAFFALVRGFQCRLLSSKWDRLVPERAALESFNNKYAVISTGNKLLERLAQNRISWSQKLNKISLKLPSMVWFRSIVFSGGNLVLQGSVLSLEKEEMKFINELIDNLKNDPSFFRGFNSLELDSVQKRVIAGYDITDFILRGKLPSG